MLIYTKINIYPQLYLLILSFLCTSNNLSQWNQGLRSI